MECVGMGYVGVECASACAYVCMCMCQEFITQRI